MSAFGTKVVAVLDTQSAFGMTLRQMRDNITSLAADINALSGNVDPAVLNRLNALEANVMALDAVDHDPSQDHLVTTSANAPTNPTIGQLWFDTDAMHLHIYMNDGNSDQWVQIS